MTASAPVSIDTLKQSASSACAKALSGVLSYDHTQTSTWSSDIINTLLSDLHGHFGSSYKLVVNSIVLQTSEAGPQQGLNVAHGAFWDNTKDGLWTYDYNEVKGVRVVVTVTWTAV
ncbi:hypothetical protein SAICODRAFT_6504 [Saitoella complicata NRRL Y-17804]|nr:uncharacterized protein SAICODRAFT_6504 [Saitoella complicata NRRL Y-17804]ODQ54220.1 hypothetical protein SAICODRAFT_6504 [Saitoella complicata NRRL Y-17804]